MFARSHVVHLPILSSASIAQAMKLNEQILADAELLFDKMMGPSVPVPASVSGMAKFMQVDPNLSPHSTSAPHDD